MDIQTKQISVQCKDEHVTVTYAKGLGMVVPPILRICLGKRVHFHFTGPSGIASIIPDDPADAPWLEKRDIRIPTKRDDPVVVDTGKATSSDDHYYTVALSARDSDGIPIEISIDPIIRPW